MLDKNTLSQLHSLKADIRASREFAVGTVASTSGRFGFVRLEDGRDAYLSPEKMQRVLPGDKVKAEIISNKDGKTEAKLEKLLESPLKFFVSNYRKKNGAHFVEPCDNQVNRWIFLPPKFRMGTEDGETVLAKVLRHPWEDGKAQAKVIQRIGNSDTPFFELLFIKAKYGLSKPAPKTQEKEIEEITDKFAAANFGDREDLSHLNFVTIDSASTQDMDDALAAEETESGFNLHVAIADPGSFVRSDSTLAREAEQRTQTLYLSGGVIPMLTEDLTLQCFSLAEEALRPALVCHLSLDKSGALLDYKLQSAIIKSRKKLNYEEVAAFLEKDEQIPSSSEEINTSIKLLHSLAQLRLDYRRKHNLVGDDQADYRLELDEKGKITGFHKTLKTCAHQLVEECMLLTNQCAGTFLQEHNSGLHSIHSGFRKDRLGEVKALLKEEDIDCEGGLDTPEFYKKLMRELRENPESSLIIPALRRMSENSRLDTQPAPHFAMGVKNYATITSPIRRFADLYNHWAILTILNAGNNKKYDTKRLQALNDNIQLVRQADRELRQWLTCLYVQNNLGKEGLATIRIVTQQGFGARLEDLGIDGFILFDKKTEKSFDAKRLTISVQDNCYHIGKQVKIKMAGADLEKRRISFELAP